MSHLFAAGAPPSLAVLAANHPSHHNIVAVVMHRVLDAVASGFGWWIGRSLAEQLGNGGVAAVALTSGPLWLINRATGGSVIRLWRAIIRPQLRGPGLRL